MSANIQQITQEVLLRHTRRYPGAEKERWMLRELLTTVGAPSRFTHANPLSDELRKAIGEDISVLPEGVFLYFFYRGHKVSQLDLSDNTMPGKSLSESLSEEQNRIILNVTRQFIRDKRGVSTMLTDWIRRYFKREPVQGILLMLDNAEEGEWQELTISPENDKHEKIEQVVSHLYHADTVVAKISILLNNGGTMEITPDENLFTEAVKLSADNIQTLEEFMQRLNLHYETLLRARDEQKGNNYKDYFINIYLPEGTKASIHVEELLLQIRTREDTQRALQRLLNIGVIDDFRETEEAFTFYFIKKSKQEYLVNLHRHLARYETTEELKKRFNKIPENADVKLIVGECLNAYVSFVYDCIVPQRALAAGQLVDQLGEEDVEMQLPVLSKYADPLQRPNLIEDTSEGSVCSWDAVWKYMDIVMAEGESSVLNIRALRRSVEELKPRYPKNPVFNLLHAFCILYLETEVRGDDLYIADKTKVKPAINNFIEGFISFKELYGVSSEELKVAVARFHQKTLSHRSELSYVMNQATELLYLELHNRWLRQFNQKFLVGYER